MSRSAPFERDLTLPDLLDGIEPRALEAILGDLEGAVVSLETPDGEALVGPSLKGRDDVATYPLRVPGHLEPVGRCVALQCSPRLLAVLGKLLELLLNSRARYRMATDLHLGAVRADYEALAETNRALAESEARYKALAHSLEERVKEQVAVIETTQRRLYQQDKLASIGQLAAGVAHEINNPIGFIKSNLNTAAQYLGRLETELRGGRDGGSRREISSELSDVLADFHALLQESLEGAVRVARIVADLKGFAHVDGDEEALADINECVRSALNVAAHEIRYRAEVETTWGAIPRLRCRPGRLNQVFLNLIVNAAQAMSDRGVIRVRTFLENGAIHIGIADTGSGIPDAILPRIFDPFFTTKDVGQGTGLGLTVSYDIVKAHGGTIEVQSAVGSGTTFTVILPLRE